MEDAEIMKTEEGEFRQNRFIIGVIVSDTTRNMRAVINRSRRGALGQALQSSKYKLDEVIPPPSLLEDPSNQVKFIFKNFFGITNYGKAQQYRCTKSAALQSYKY